MENPKHSPIGVTSFFMGVICGLLATFVIFFQAIAGYFSSMLPTNQGIVEILFFVLLLGNFVAIVLGIASFFQKNRRKLFGLMGTVFSAGMLFLNIGLFIIIDVNF
jgi:uncharacterized membrane protein